MRLTLAAVQMASELGNPMGNMQRAERLLQKIKGRPALAVLPEMALTGYAFGSQKAIQPFLEHAETGETATWATKMAKKYGLNICVGYPEEAPPSWDGIAYNSANLINDSGKLLMHYRKTHLFSSDRAWGCIPSPYGFQAKGPWPELPLRIQIGICMDLNPWEFQAPWNAFEFAKSVDHNRAQLVLCPMAWLATSAELAGTIDEQLVAYWRARLPLTVPAVFANQFNVPGDNAYGGSSTIYDGDVWSIPGEGILERTIDFVSPS